MAVPAPSRPNLSVGETLGEELARLQEFVGLLQREQALLTGSETEALLVLIENKNALANVLADLSRTRENRLQALGLASGRAGMDAWLASNGTDNDRRGWSQLLALAATARDLNALNGKLIGMHMQHNQQALTALLSAADNAATYGPDGHQQTGLGGRMLGKA